MDSKIMQIFYGNDCLPYKDKERTIHYPVIGNSFTGANNTTQIRFYVRDIGGTANVQWVAVSKLPNGQIGNKVLSSPTYDSELEEYYVALDLSAYYTSIKGEVYISLNGYQGDVLFEQDPDTGIYEISGTPTIQATGVVKIAINYAPQIIQGTHFQEDDLQQVLGALSEKLNIVSSIFVYETGADLSGLDEGQLCFNKTTGVLNIISSGQPVQYTLVYTKAELDTLFGQKADKYGPVPFFVVNMNDNVINFITNNNIDHNPVIILYSGESYLGVFSQTGANRYSFNFVSLNQRRRLQGTDVSMGGGFRFYQIFGGDTYLHNFELEENKTQTINSGSTTSQYPSAKAVYDKLQTKQDTLVSGTNIKTINSQSILGAGNIDIQGGGGNAEWGDITGDITDQTDLMTIINRINLIAQGKTKSWIVSILSVAPTNDNIQNYRKLDGTYFEDFEDFDNYINEGLSPQTVDPDNDCGNSLLDTQDESVDMARKYLITKDNFVLNDAYLYNEYLTPDGNHTLGDIIITLEKLDSQGNKLPDRWLGIDYLLHAWDSSVEDLDAYYTKIQTDALLLAKVSTSFFGNTPAYDNTATYSVGDLVIYQGAKYRANTDILVPEDFDPTHWDEITIEDYPTKAGNETISGTWTFSQIDFGDGAKIYKDSSNRIVIQYNNSDKIKVASANTIIANRIDPDNDNSQDIGRSTVRWRDGYFGGQVYAQNTLNVINASDIVSNTLTQAQYDLITNGKTTRIVGLLGNYNDAVILQTKIYTTYTFATITGLDNYGQTIIGNIRIANSGFSISFLSTYRIIINESGVEIQSLNKINGKVLSYYLNNVYPYATNSTTELKYETINNITLSADTTFTLATSPADTYPEYKANITNSGASDITITLPSGTTIKGNVSISSNTFVIPAGSEVELNIQNDKAIVVEW